MVTNRVIRQIVPMRSRLSWLRRNALAWRPPHHNAILNLPHVGSLGMSTRVVLHPEDCFTWPMHKYAHMLLRKTIEVPVKIRPRWAPTNVIETNLQLNPIPPIIVDFRAILIANELPVEEDYTLEFPVETNAPELPIIEIQMKEFDAEVWGSFVTKWPIFKDKDRGFVMLNPKFTISERRDTLSLLTYQSDEPTMPESNKVNYVICDEAGEVLVRSECTIQKNSFVLLPTPNERELLWGNCSMFARAEQSLATITLNRDLSSKLVSLEHTQPLQKYSRIIRGRERILDLKLYWHERIPEL